MDGLLVLLHTMGGDVEAGLAIAEMIAGMTKPTVTLVLGGGHSIGIPLAVAGKVTLMAPSASMTIHPIRMSGLMIAAPQTPTTISSACRTVSPALWRLTPISPRSASAS